MVTVMGVTAYYKINPTEISITQNMLRELIWSAMTAMLCDKSEGGYNSYKKHLPQWGICTFGPD